MTTAAEQGFEDIYFTSSDGLRLYGRHYRAIAPSGARPVRMPRRPDPQQPRFSRDRARLEPERHTAARRFHARYAGPWLLGSTITNWKNYAVPIEMQDVIDFMTMLGLREAGIIGTSRGGLITMVLAAVQPSLVGAVVLNDIGPVIEMEGLARIAGYVGRVPLPKSWADATRIVSDLMRRDFPT